MILDLAILAVVLAAAAVMFSARVSGITRWRAMVTPLASIIGSGFLVLGPILLASYGRFAPLAMLALCAGAYLFGAAVRFNIATIALAQSQGGRSAAELAVEMVASWALAFAYFISVAYYLNLFGAFGVSIIGYRDGIEARLLTSAIFLAILAVGWWRGFKVLERLEYASVTVKLSIIVGLLVGLAASFAVKLADGGLVFNPPALVGVDAVTLAFGLLITVQGFETSRYLGRHYDPPMRIRSMQLAQWVTTAIYMVYIGLITYLFQRSELKLSETAIIDMMRVVSPVLPALLVAAALSAQFSAAIADTAGSGGLLSELTRGAVTPRQAYLLLTAVGLLLTWTADVFQIISYASRAFAFYYAMEALIALLGAARLDRGAWRVAGFLALFLLGLAIVVLGEAVVA
ncbi:MAG: hypothetical protein R3D33_11770 [Hyphomicrobiaceae bacterium]